MATSGMDRSIKVWDIRLLKGPLQDYKVRTSPRSMVFSQTGCLAVAINNAVDVSKTDRYFDKLIRLNNYLGL